MNTKEMTYSQAVEELQEILDRLDEGDIPVDELHASVERAIELLRFCHRQLHTIDESVRKSLEKLDQMADEADEEEKERR